MAGPHPSPWTRLLLATLLSVSFPGDMGESGTPLQHPSWWGHTLKALPSHGDFSQGVSPRYSLSYSTNRPLHTVRAGDP